MLTLQKIRGLKVKNMLIGVFALGVVSGVGIPYFSVLGSNTASAATGTVAANALPAATGAAVTYTYNKMSSSDAYPLYIMASFTAASGLFLYAITFVPLRKTAPSRYASRTTTWAKNTY